MSEQAGGLVAGPALEEEPARDPGRDPRNWGIGLVDVKRLLVSPVAGGHGAEGAESEALRGGAFALLDRLSDQMRAADIVLDAAGVRLVAEGVRAGHDVAHAHWTSRRKPSASEVRHRAVELARETLGWIRDEAGVDIDDASASEGLRTFDEVLVALGLCRTDAIKRVQAVLGPVFQPRACYLSRSWSHIRACLGDRESMIVLASELRKIDLTPLRMGKDEGKILADAWERLSGARHEHQAPYLAKATPIVADASFDLVDGAEAALKPYGVKLPPRVGLLAKASDAPEPGPNEMRVLASIGDPDSSEGKNATKRFAGLLSPLELRGGAEPDAVWRALQAEFPWMEEANRHVAGAVAVAAKRPGGAFLCRPILLYGRPGVGKSRYARRVAELCRVPFSLLPLGGSASSVVLKGTERGWSNARPSHVAIVLNQDRVANPLILCDEVDKCGTSNNNGNPLDVLLGLLEPETARRFQDDFLLASLDCSAVTWVLTANDISRLSQPFLSRVDIVRVGQPVARHFDMIYRGVLRDVAADLRIPVEALPDIEPARPDLERAFAVDLSMRLLKEAVARAVRAAVWQPPGPRAID